VSILSSFQVGANGSKSVTKVSSLGMWLPIHDEEWDGDIPLGLTRSPGPQVDTKNGTVVFKGNTLPWLVGNYEVRSPFLFFTRSSYIVIQVRYHHDGKYNVLSTDGFEIYGAITLALKPWFANQFVQVIKPSDPLTFTSVRYTLMHIVPLCLDSDPSLVPQSCQIPVAVSRDSDLEIISDLDAEQAKADEDSVHPDRDPDDFTFWTEKQAKRISTAIKQIFDVECAPEVVLADANLTTLANRIIVSKEVLSTSSISSSTVL